MDKSLLFSDIWCAQEHFLSDCNDKEYSNTDKMRAKFNYSHDMFIVPARKDNNQVSRGRAGYNLEKLSDKVCRKILAIIQGYKLLCSGFLIALC